MQRHVELPEFFVDRSLGRIKVPQLLRQAGLTIVTLADRYGIPTDETVTDEQWLVDAGGRSEAVLTKDARIRYNRAEKEAIKRFGVRCFCLVRQDLSANNMAGRFIDNLDRIVAACREPGPFLYAVHVRRIERLVHTDSALRVETWGGAGPVTRPHQQSLDEIHPSRIVATRGHP